MTGWDEVVYTFRPPREVHERFRAMLAARWPGAVVEDLDVPGSAPEPLAGYGRDRLPDPSGELLYYRDAAMVRHMDEEAYVPMADGEGPFALISRVRREVELRIDGVHEVHKAREGPPDPLGGKPPEPYLAYRSTPLVYEMTVVLPQCPEELPFSRWVLDRVIRACREMDEAGNVG
jgi:hypothetical protein